MGIRMNTAMMCVATVNFLVCGMAIAQGAESASSEGVVSILVLSDIQNTHENRVKYEAVNTICDELQLTGFNVMENRGGTFGQGVRHELAEAFKNYPVSAAVVVTQSSPRDGNVTLFVNRAATGVRNIASFYIEFPLNRDRAEVVALKVSENVALVTDGMTITEPTAAKTPAEASAWKDAENAYKQEAVSAEQTVVPDKRTHNLGVYLHLGAEFSPGDTGFFGGPTVGMRWYPSEWISLDAIASVYMLGKDITDDDSKSSFDFALGRFRGAYEKKFNEAISLNIGLILGFGFIWVRGEAKTETNGAETSYKKESGFFPFGGGSVELIWSVTKRIWVPLCLDVSASFSKVAVEFEGAEVATFGLPMITLSSGVGVRF